MKIANSFFRAPTAHKPRLSLCLPCTLFSLSAPVEAETFNISYCGLGIKFPTESKGPDWATVTNVLITEIGLLDVQMRWKRGDRAGLALRNVQQMRPMLATYFRHLGAHPV